MNNKEIRILTKTVINPIEISEGNLKAKLFEAELKRFFPEKINEEAKRQFFTPLEEVALKDMENLNTSHIPFLFHLTNQSSLEKRRKSWERKDPEKASISFSVNLFHSLLFLEHRFSYIYENAEDILSLVSLEAFNEVQKKICSPVLCITKLEPIISGTSSYLHSLKRGDEWKLGEFTAQGILSPEECFFIKSSQELEKLFSFISKHYAITSRQKRAVEVLKHYLSKWKHIEECLSIVEKLST